MILSPVVSAFDEGPFPVSVRLIGTLDRALIETLADTFTGLAVAGRRTLIVIVKDLVVMRDESLKRFLGLLDTFRRAGHAVFIEETPAWRRAVRGLGSGFDQSTPEHGRRARRQVMLCHSSDRRLGAA